MKKTIRIIYKSIAKRLKLGNKKTIALFFASFLIFGFYYIFANENDNKEIEETTENYEDNKDTFYQSLLPARNWDIAAEEPNIQARSALVVYIDSAGNKKFIFEKDKDLKVPVASITKLMTALIILENYNLDEQIIISEEAFSRDISRINNFYIGEQYTVANLLHPLLMESSNTAAYALAQRINSFPENYEPVSIAGFVELMNQKALSLGMLDTYFVNPSGLDPLLGSETTNYSTGKDLVLLIEDLLERPLIWEILSLPEFNLIRTDGFQKHTIINTNALLEEIPKIVGGKTGTTARALQCLVLVTEREEGEYLISIVLGSRDRFNETKKMIEWVNDSYHWEITN